MFFSQDKASKPPLYMHTARRKKRSFTGNSARTSKKISDGVLPVLRAKFDAVFGKLSPNLSSFSAMFFRKTRKMSADVQAYSERNLTPYSGNSALNLKSFFGDVFSQDKENERRRTNVLQAKFDAVLRKNSPKNQISIMSASFFFAISSISLTYLSVIF